MAEDLLSWYDVNARDLPWRISPGDGKKDISPNPYYIWMSEIMLQQTTVAAVKEYFIKFTTLWPTVFDMAEANDDFLSIHDVQNADFVKMLSFSNYRYVSYVDITCSF